MQAEHPLAVLLQDMYLAGVTDVVAETPFDLSTDKIENPFEADTFTAPAEAQTLSVQSQSHSTEPSVVTTPTAVEKTEVVEVASNRNISDMIWNFGDKSAAVHIVLSSSAQKGLHPLAVEAKTLFEKMLQSIGVEESSVAYTVLSGVSDYKNSEKKIVLEELTKIREGATVLFVGEDASKLVFGKGLFKSRVQANVFADQPCGVVMHPESLMAQPLLKKLAWQDLLKFKALKEGTV